MVDLLLLRHAESVWNVQRRWQGQADPPLSQRGRQQAALAGQRLDGVDLVAASTLQRAFDSAAIISEQLGVGAPLEMPEFIERDVREFSGLTREEIKERFGWEFSAGKRRPDGWEADERLLQRVTAGLRRLQETAVRLKAGTVLAVTHGGVIYMVEEHLGCTSKRIPNMSGRWLHINGSGGVRPGERVDLLAPEELADPGVQPPTAATPGDLL